MFVALFSVGEGWHNYHHAFPWDYRASELGSPLNLTGFLIDILAKFGLVYDRKEATHNMVKNRVLRTGDDSHGVYGNEEGRSAFKTLFNIWKHPLNPTYTSIYAPKPKIIESNGYALIQEELSKNEQDEEILSKENEVMEQQHHHIHNHHHHYDHHNGNMSNGTLMPETNNNLIVKLSQLMGAGDKDANGIVLKECNNNNNNPMNGSRNLIAKDKSDLNINVDDVLLVKM